MGHILHIGPLELGPVTPLTLLAAVEMFDFLYRQEK